MSDCNCLRSNITTQQAFTEYTLRCISVQLQVDNHVLEQAVAGFVVRAVGRSCGMGLAQPRAAE